MRTGYIILLVLLVLLFACGVKETFIINHENKKCPSPWNNYQTLLVGDKCKIRKSYILYDAPKICCMNDFTFSKNPSNTECLDKDCGVCKERNHLYKVRGNIYYPYKKFSTYCRPGIKNYWKYKKKV
tara:strand:- start:14082 stop:14462 length:381 start_codon:yes stop_codon:yes gene_type:complete